MQYSLNIWRNEWGYKIMLSSYTSSSQGVAICFKNTYEFEIVNESLYHLLYLKYFDLQSILFGMFLETNDLLFL
jgi:hypothetical protein